MGKKEMQISKSNDDGLFSNISHMGFQLSPQDCTSFYPGGLFASIGQSNGLGFAAISPPNSGENDLYVKYVTEETRDGIVLNKKKKGGIKFKVKIANTSLRRLVSGAIAGAISRTAVAPLETIRTHLMVGSSGHSSTEVFNNIMQTDGWKGLFRGNLVNVIRVAPSKAIEVKD